MSCGVGGMWVAESEWLWPTYGEFGAQKKVMWNCTICSSYGSAVLYFKNLTLKDAVALIFFNVGRSDLSVSYGDTWSMEEGELIWISS